MWQEERNDRRNERKQKAQETVDERKDCMIEALKTVSVAVEGAEDKRLFENRRMTFGK